MILMRWILILLAVVGITSSALALREHYRTDTSPCSINERWDCGIVNHSPYAVIAGIPVAVIGIAGYLLLAALAFQRAYRLMLLPVLATPVARTSGRMPANTLSTSSRVGAFARYWPAVARMNSISFPVATGSSVGSGIGVSVVPTSVWPCHGIAKSTRPSLVCGTIIALLPGRKLASKTR